MRTVLKTQGEITINQKEEGVLAQESDVIPAVSCGLHPVKQLGRAEEKAERTSLQGCAWGKGGSDLAWVAPTLRQREAGKGKPALLHMLGYSLVCGWHTGVGREENKWREGEEKKKTGSGR